MIDKSLVEEYVKKLKTQKFKLVSRTPRDFKGSGYKRQKFGWIKKTRDGTSIYYNGQDEMKHE